MKHLVGVVKSIADDAENPNGAFEVILSAPTLDRDGEVIDAKAFDPLPDHITFDIDHGLSVATTVGSGVPFYDGDLLKVRGTYSSIPRAQEVRTLVAEGHIRTTSVAYMGAKTYKGKDGAAHIKTAELLNGAFVPVPSNREAVVLASKGITPAARPGLKTVEGSFEERRESISLAIQMAHTDAWWTYPIATFPDSVVYEVESATGVARFRSDYSIDADGVVMLGDAEPVDVVEVVQPAKGADGDSKTPDPTPADPAPAAARPAVGARARLTAELAEAELLLT